MPERRVAPGDHLTITAAHDTYGLSFTVGNDTAGDAPVAWEPEPLQVLLAASCVCCFACVFCRICKCKPEHHLPKANKGEGLGV